MSIIFICRETPNSPPKLQLSAKWTYLSVTSLSSLTQLHKVFEINIKEWWAEDYVLLSAPFWSVHCCWKRKAIALSSFLLYYIFLDYALLFNSYRHKQQLNVFPFFHQHILFNIRRKPIKEWSVFYLSIRLYDSCRRLPETKRHSSLFLHWSVSKFLVFMAACTPSIHVFLGRPLFLLSSGTHSIMKRIQEV